MSLIVGTHVKARVLSLLWKGFECNGEYCFMASGIKCEVVSGLEIKLLFPLPCLVLIKNLGYQLNLFIA